MNQTAVEHSRHIVAELLELLIDSDTLGLTVDEIEGDAILFHRDGEPPSLDELVRQSEEMFIKFHAHLRAYDERRICDCGACTTAHTLSLKFVAHAGPLDFVKVRDFRKPYGPDVILVHRLLKNDVPSREYLLVTHATHGAEPSGPDWGNWESAASSYDGLEPTTYRYLQMEPLRARIPEPESIVDFPRLARPRKLEAIVPIDIEEAYDLVSNLSRRRTWNEEVDDFIYEPNRVNRAGTHHQCVVNGKPIDFQTIAADYGEGAKVYGERVDSVPIVDSFAIFWILTAEGEHTRVRSELHYRPKPGVAGLLAPIFPLIFRKVFAKGFEAYVARARQIGNGDPSLDGQLTPPKADS